MRTTLDSLIDKEGNVYELTSVAIKEVAVLSAKEGEQIEKNGDKVVSVALDKVLNDEVEYSIEGQN